MRLVLVFYLAGWVGCLLLLTSQVSAAESPVIRKYCTKVGVVWLEFRDEKVVGTYQVLVPGKRINGVIYDGLMKNHLLDARWKDPDGAGRILFFFHDSFAGFSAMYNHDRNPAHWYPVWVGKSKQQIGQEPQESQGNWICEKVEI